MNADPIQTGVEVILYAKSEHGQLVLEQDGELHKVVMYRDDVCFEDEHLPAYLIESKQNGRSRWIRRYKDPNFIMTIPKGND